jgi:cell division transport system ATP-binding protein
MVATHDATLLARYQKRTVRLERGQIVSDEDGVKAARRMTAV